MSATQKHRVTMKDGSALTFVPSEDKAIKMVGASISYSEYVADFWAAKNEAIKKLLDNLYLSRK